MWTFFIGLAVNLAISGVRSQAIGPHGSEEGFTMLEQDQPCDGCHWTAPNGAYFNLFHLCNVKKQYVQQMARPTGATLEFGVCQYTSCNNAPNSLGCVYVPGNEATSTGKKIKIGQIEENIPSEGVRLIYHDGEMCAITRKPRKTIIHFECVPEEDSAQSYSEPLRGWEGEGSDTCIYNIYFPTTYGCPTRKDKYAPLKPHFTAVTGCVDSVPRLSTTDCYAGGGTEITLYGFDFIDDPDTVGTVWVHVGDQPCDEPKIINAWTVTCKLRPGVGQNLIVSLTFKLKRDHNSQMPGFVPRTTTPALIVSSSQATVSYKQLVDYKRHFHSFIDLGVGGLGKQIDELYQRAFASRSIPSSVLKQMGIDHARGILLYGPPGSGKTLLARTIAKILKTDQVKMINAPEIMSKYLGESEKNLRSYFEEAEKAWAELGDASDLYVIVIDEIEAICKPRGKSDSSAAAAAYDSVVNQLLTKMDGLKTLHNVLVLGLTNRKELIDPALLRPGRFEVQIEIGLPDQRGRWEILNIHTQVMRENGYMAQDVDLDELSINTTQFSGAEIAGLVRLAASYALDRKYGRTKNDYPLQVTKLDFYKALMHVKPASTRTELQVLKEFLPRGYISCGKSHENIVTGVSRLAEVLFAAKHGRVESVLLYGPKGVGKSGLAAHLASLLKINFIKVLTPNILLRLHEDARIETFIEAFQEAFRENISLLLLDDLHNLLQVVKVDHDIRVSHVLLHTLSTLMTSLPAVGCKLLVIGTLFSPSRDLQKHYTGRIGLQDLFSTQMYVPELDTVGASTFLNNLNITRPEGRSFHLPKHFHISVRNILKVTDCIEYEMHSRGGHLSRTPQDVLDYCTTMYNSAESVTINIT